MRVRGTVEEVRVAEGDVLDALRHLRRDVGDDDVGWHDAELPVVDGHDRAVAAAVLAAAAGLGVAGDAPRAAVLERRVPLRRRKAGAVGRDEREARDRRPRRARSSRPSGAGAAVASVPATNADEVAPRTLRRTPPRCPSGAADSRVRRRVEAERAEARLRVAGADAVDHRQRQARGRVHRQVERHHVGRRRRPSRPAAAARGRGTVTSAPARRSQAAGDARPKGWRPIS